MRAFVLALLLIAPLAHAGAARVDVRAYVAGYLNGCGVDAPGAACFDIAAGETLVTLEVVDERAPEVAFWFGFGASDGSACSRDATTLEIPEGATTLAVIVYPAGHAACGSLVEAMPATTGIVTARFA